jgi:hypothetical protein
MIVAGTASKPKIKLQSQSQLAQADILPLLFRRITTNPFTLGTILARTDLCVHLTQPGYQHLQYARLEELLSSTCYGCG